VLEKLPGEKGPITKEMALNQKTVPVAFLSRKLTKGQADKWPIKEKETYAIISALEKWSSWIGLQPVLVLSDHKSLESWAHEILDGPTGPTGRQARWHLKLSHFDVTVGYVAGKDNTIGDILSRWAYPASEGTRDVSIHGSPADDEEMRGIIEEEERLERECAVVRLRWPLGYSEKAADTREPVAVLKSCRPPRVLELFAGDGSWRETFAKMGFETHTLDWNPRFSPTFCCDIREWNEQQFEPGFFDIVVSSPPSGFFDSERGGKKIGGFFKGRCLGQASFANHRIPPTGCMADGKSPWIFVWETVHARYTLCRHRFLHVREFAEKSPLTDLGVASH
jgi:hypothetical protein